MTDWIMIGLLAAILAVMVVRWVRDEWAWWQGLWFKVRRRR